MSQYITSFLIDPVVRQARRFSRPNDESADQEIRSSRSFDAEGESLRLPSPAPGTNLGSLPYNAITDEPEIPILDFGNEPCELQHRVFEREPSALMDRLRDAAFEHENNVDRRSQVAPPAASRYPLSNLQNDLSFTFSTSGSNQPIMGTSRSLTGSSPLDFTAIPAFSNSGRHDFPGIKPGDSTLPADDGMSYMRKRIRAIHRTNSSNVEKARLVHALMTEKHYASKQSLQPAFRTARTQSAGSGRSSERPFTPSSSKSWDSLRRSVSPPTASLYDADSTNPFHLLPEDLRPSYYQGSLQANDEEDQEACSTEVDEGPKALGCAHYKRNIKLQCSACHRWYTCRFCHDEVENHMLNRRETKSMLCMFCGYAQPASAECIECNERAAWYYCDICKLWDDDPEKSIYHCYDCGICRVGQGLGKDFFHCKKCCVCMSVAIQDTHRCIERSTDCDCPICGEYMFTSPQKVVFMKCGHSIHSQCYHEHMKTSYRCPICSKSVVNMEYRFMHLKRAIASQQMPHEFRDTKAWVYCNDCNAKSIVKYHWLGLECEHCDSYNTAQLQLMSGVDPSQEASDGVAHASQTGGISQVRLNSHARGRPRSMTTYVERSAVSTPPLVALRNLFQRSSWPQMRARHTRSLPPNTTFYSPHLLAEDCSDAGGSSDCASSWSEVDFWGGESPRLRVASPRPEHDMNHNPDDGYDDDDKDDDDEEEEEEEDEDSDEDDISDDHQDEDSDDDSRIEIFGHR